MNLILAAVPAALLLIAATAVALRRANQRLNRILDGRRWKASTTAEPDWDDALDVVTEAEDIARAAAETWRTP